MNALFDFSPFVKDADKILASFWASIRLSAMTGLLSLIFGTLLAAMRVSPTPIARVIGTLYVNTLRNTPLTLLLLLVSLGLSDTLQIRLSDQSTVNAYWLAVFGFSAYTAAFVCEAVRSGINTVPLGQAEAARAIGLTSTQ